MNLFDLHCDTIVPLKKNCWDLVHTETMFNLKNPLEKQAQCMAVFVPDYLRGRHAVDYILSHRRYMDFIGEKNMSLSVVAGNRQSIEKAFDDGKCALIPTIESGAALGGDLSNIRLFKDKGFLIMTLVWNGENELGSGNDSTIPLTSFGREAVCEMERCNLIVDVSHLNDPGFDSLCEIATKPFIATHSNSRRICPNKRNLTDAQLEEIFKRKGLVGLNLYQAFISTDTNGGTKENLFRHIYHMLELGGLKHIACGSDFDGAAIHPSLDTPEKFAMTAEYFSHMGLKDDEINNIFFDNAADFFNVNL